VLFQAGNVDNHQHFGLVAHEWLKQLSEFRVPVGNVVVSLVEGNYDVL